MRVIFTDFYDNVRDIDVQEDVKLANFKEKTCGCVRLLNING